MADTKITALTALTAADPANDVIPIVDVSDTTMAASGTTKKISVNNILGASGTATLASATITGDLTVDTSTLKVDSANNRVGVGTASPAKRCEINQSANAFTTIGEGEILRLIGDDGNTVGRITEIGFGTGPTGAVYAPVTLGAINTSITGYNHKAFYIATRTGTSDVAPVERYRIANDGIATWSNVGGVAGTAMTLNANGLGVGVTPSAWGNASKVVQVGQAGCIYGRAAFGYYGTKFNLYNDNTNDIAISSNFVGEYRFEITNGSHVWLNKSTAGTINTNQTLTQAMTLDASGNLMVGVASSSNRLDIQKSTDCAVLVKSTGANTNIAMDYVSNYGNHTIRKSGTAVWDFGVINDSSATPAFKFSNGPSAVGVQLVHGATAWTALSDETVKDIIEPITNAITKVGSLRSVIGKFKTDDASKRRSFLIAQDVFAVLPEAVDVVGEKNELGVRYSDVIPLLVAAIKELSAEVNALKNA